MDVLILGSSNLPSVILCVEQEVGADDGDADSDDGQDHEDQEHEAVHVVDLVSPERGEDEVPVDHKIRVFVYKKSCSQNKLTRLSFFVNNVNKM